MVLFLEAIQSRCAVLRYSKLTDAQILERLMTVCDKEKVCVHFSFVNPYFRRHSSLRKATLPIFGTLPL